MSTRPETFPQVFRWMQLVYWERQDLQELHRREQHWASMYRNCQEKNLRYPSFHWQDSGFIDKMAEKYHLVPFWPDMSQEEVEAKSKLFQGQIYPIWAPIAHEPESPKYHMLDDHTRIDKLHRCDWAIYESGHRPERISRQQVDTFRKKAAMGEKFAQAWKGNE